MSKQLKLQSSVQVVVTLTVDAQSSWNSDATCSQVYDQAARETIAGLQNLLTKSGFRPQFAEEKVKVTTYMVEK